MSCAWLAHSQFSVILTLAHTETIRTIYIVRAPSVFPALYAMVKPFLAQETRSKVHVLGSDFKKVLLDVVSPDVLFDFLGNMTHIHRQTDTHTHIHTYTHMR